MSHSSTVALFIELEDDLPMPLTHVETDQVILKHHKEIAPQSADVIVTIDGRFTKTKVDIVSQDGKILTIDRKIK